MAVCCRCAVVLVGAQGVGEERHLGGLRGRVERVWLPLCATMAVAGRHSLSFGHANLGNTKRGFEQGERGALRLNSVFACFFFSVFSRVRSCLRPRTSTVPAPSSRLSSGLSCRCERSIIICVRRIQGVFVVFFSRASNGGGSCLASSQWFTGGTEHPRKSAVSIDGQVWWSQPVRRVASFFSQNSGDFWESWRSNGRELR